MPLLTQPYLACLANCLIDIIVPGSQAPNNSIHNLHSSNEDEQTWEQRLKQQAATDITTTT